MRVISGKFKGRLLQAVPGNGTRPTSDKVKESIFNIIGPYFNGGWALDLYAGTGGLAIEALSRGIERSVLVDIDPKAIKVIKQNLAALQLEPQCEVYRTDADRAIKALIKRQLLFSLVFLDPPYARQNIAEQIKRLADGQLLAPAGWVVAESDRDVSLPQEIGPCLLERRVEYGDTAISLYHVRSETCETDEK